MKHYANYAIFLATISAFVGSVAGVQERASQTLSHSNLSSIPASLAPSDWRSIKQQLFDAGAQTYLKPSNTGGDDQFALSVAVYEDTVVIGAHREDSGAIGINGVIGQIKTSHWWALQNRPV